MSLSLNNFLVIHTNDSAVDGMSGKELKKVIIRMINEI
jgi:hypothetical protein